MSEPASPRDVIECLIQGISKGGWLELHELYAEDAVVEYPFALPSGPARLAGRPAIRRYFAAVARPDDDAARADHKGTLRIENVQAIEGINQTCSLMFPAKAAVRGVENQSVGTDRPPVKFVRGETNGADGIALGLRILPLPATLRNLAARSRKQRRHDERHETERPGGFAETGSHVTPN